MTENISCNALTGGIVIFITPTSYKDPHKEIRGIADFIDEALTNDQLNEIVVNTNITRAKQSAERAETEDDKYKKQFNLVRTGN